MKVPSASTLFSLGVLLAACSGADATAPAGDPKATQGTDGTEPSIPDPGVDPQNPDVPKGMIVDLRADTNRDGQIRFDDPADDAGEDVWDDKHGAIFLANIDDDLEACPKTGNDVDLPK